MTLFFLKFQISGFFLSLTDNPRFTIFPDPVHLSVQKFDLIPSLHSTIQQTHDYNELR